jgi:surface carbohydrate biosynthesis protein
VAKSSENKKLAPIVYLPVEFEAREFDGKCLLATVLAERGYSAVLGQQWMLYANIERLPPGVFLFKSFNKIHQGAMKLARQAGHRVVILEEELLAQTQEQAIVGMSPEEIFELSDLILTNGRFEHDILKRRSKGRGRIEIAGNARVDILKPALQSIFRNEVDTIKEKYGDFVLVNTNFSIRNSIWESLEQVTKIQIQAGFVKPDDPASLKQWDEYVAFEDRNTVAMHAAVRELARRRPQQKIVIRPHPGEDLRRWDGLYRDCPSVVVIREGAHIPWTLASRVLLHTSCTTGFEAEVAGKVALSLLPLRDWISDSILSNHVNPTFEKPLDLVEETEKILDGGERPVAKAIADVGNYVWNWSEKNGTQRVADLLVEGIAPSAPVPLPSLQAVALNEKMKEKFSVSLERGTERLRRIAKAAGGQEKLNIHPLGEGLFYVSKHAVAVKASTPPKFDAAALLARMQADVQSRNFEGAYTSFKKNFGDAHRYPDLCFLAGVAVSELGKYELALQYFQQATVAAGQVVNYNYAFSLARTYEKLKDYENAWRYAQLAYRAVPVEPNFFALYKHLCTQTKRNAPEHWIVIGCSHVRYFRYMQINQPKFFGSDVHLECHEFAGATAYGLGNPNSDSGALSATRQLRERIAAADRVLINFGEIDCRRAAWKAASISGRPIEEHITESAKHLETYIEREILPLNRNVLLIGAKPQIIADQDFYRASLEDERTIFKPLPEREKVTLDYNAKLKATAERLKLDYVDLDDTLKDEKSRRHFFDRVFWDDFTDDTHGSVDFFAGLYFERLKKFTDKPRPAGK